MKRIRKVSQSTPIKAKVVNSYSESEEETYSCDYMNEHKEEYSTDEQVIGKWIDGKTLFRKVYQSSEFLNIYSIPMNNVDTIVDINGVIKRSDYNIYCKIPYRTGEASWNTSFGNINIVNNRIETSLLYGSSFSTTNFSNIVITVKYTKTTG